MSYHKNAKKSVSVFLKVSILGTDDFTTNIAVLVRHSGSGAVGLTQVNCPSCGVVLRYVALLVE